MDGNTQEPDAQADLPASPFSYEGKPAAAGQTDALSEDDRSSVSGFLGDTKALNVPAVESVFFDSILSAAHISDEMQGLAQDYHDNGFVVLENLFEPELIDKIVGHYPWLFDPKTIPTLPGHVQELFKLDPARRLDAWWACDEVQQLAAHPKILELLQLLYGRRAIPFQTLNFLYGTEQPAHSDAIHFSCLPAGFMCGVWVALEDATLENGALVYYPGSHKLPEVQLSQLGLWGQAGYTAHGGGYGHYENYVRAVVNTHGLQEKRLEIPKGTALIWSSNLLHGGSAISKHGATRMSQVTHYYFEGCTYFAPILSDVALGEYKLKEVRDISTNEIVPHTLNGEPLTVMPGANGRSRITRPGGGEHRGFDPDVIARMEKLKQELEATTATPEASPDGDVGTGSDPASQLAPEDAAEAAAANAERERLRLYAKTLEAERDHLRGRVDDLEGALKTYPGTPIYKVFRAIKNRINPTRLNGDK